MAESFTVKYAGNYDGDTIQVEIPECKHILFCKKMAVRIRGIDTPEVHGINPCEKDKALLAKAFVKKQLENTKKIELKNVAKDKYFRLLADVTLDGTLLKDKLLSKNLAIPYNGGKKAPVNWCYLKNEKQIH